MSENEKPGDQPLSFARGLETAQERKEFRDDLDQRMREILAYRDGLDVKYRAANLDAMEQERLMAEMEQLDPLIEKGASLLQMIKEVPIDEIEKYLALDYKKIAS